MKYLVRLLIVPVVTSGSCLAAVPPTTVRKPANIRTFLDCPGLPREAQRSGVSAKFYKSLAISPLEAWIVVRAPINGLKAAGARVVRCDAVGAFDDVALALANSMEVSGLNYTESHIHVSSIDVHLLI